MKNKNFNETTKYYLCNLSGQIEFQAIEYMIL